MAYYSAFLEYSCPAGAAEILPTLAEVRSGQTAPPASIQEDTKDLSSEVQFQDTLFKLSIGVWGPGLRGFRFGGVRF